MFANNLPTETWILIMTYLDPISLLTISGVSRQYYLLSNDQGNWKKFCISNGIKISLIEDLDSPSANKDGVVNWKQLYLKAVRIKERDMFFDMLIRKTSDETLFGYGLQRALSTTLELFDGEKCEQCRQEKSILRVNCRQASRILWDLPEQPRSFLDHTLKIGCDWSRMAIRSRVPREFLLNYDSDNAVESALDLERLRLVEEQY